MTMTKADIVERIYEKVGFSKKEATEVVESIFELVKRRLEQGEKVSISEITDQFVEVNAGETARPEKRSVETYRELQAIQDEMSKSLRGAFGKHRQFVMAKS